MVVYESIRCPSCKTKIGLGNATRDIGPPRVIHCPTCRWAMRSPKWSEWDEMSMEDKIWYWYMNFFGLRIFAPAALVFLAYAASQGSHIYIAPKEIWVLFGIGLWVYFGRRFLQKHATEVRESRERVARRR